MLDGPAADCHAHVFGGREFPFAPDAVYLPQPNQRGTATEFRAVLEAHGLTHGLLVAAQPYAYDNSCMLQALSASAGRFKGIALVRPDITERALTVLGDQGVVGIRFNLSTHGMKEFLEPGAERLLAQVKEKDWFLQIHCEHDQLAEAAPILRRAGVRVMIDHFGRPNAPLGIAQPGFSTLQEFGRDGRHVIKLSGPFRTSLTGPPYYDVDPFIHAAIEAFTLDRCVWGSDWPFVRVDTRIDYGPQLACVARWLPAPADRRKLLWETPARLFGFGQAT